jgi:hypothetical protein
MSASPLVLSAPVSAHNLTAWFLLAPAQEQAAPPPDYLVLGEAMTAGAAVVHETGTVNQLLIENLGAVDLFLQAGDIVKGGRQDRTIGTDFIVPARSGRVPMPVFCVESGRWHRRSHESDAVFAESKHALASKKARMALREKDQRKVWDEIAEEQRALEMELGAPVRASASPSSLELSYEQEGLQRELDDYLVPLAHAYEALRGGTADAVQPSLWGAAPGAGGERGALPLVGVVWAINGAPSHADRYASPALFAKLWEKLLRAAATEALREGRQERRRMAPPGWADDAMALGVPSGDEILAWLEGRALQDPAAAPERVRATEEQLPPRTRVTERRGATQARVAAYDTAWAGGEPVHRAVLAG